MSNRYFVVVNGKPTGPYGISQLPTLGLTPYTFVKTEQMDDYKEAQEIEELRNLFNFKAPLVSPQYFASFDQRLMAWAIDAFLIALFCAVVAFVMFLFVTSTEMRIKLLLSTLFIGLTANYVYGVIADASAKRGTVGKRLMDIKVADTNGEQLSLAKSFVRTTVKAFSIFGLGIGCLVMFTNRKNQCLHDMAANAIVSKDRLV